MTKVIDMLNEEIPVTSSAIGERALSEISFDGLNEANALRQRVARIRSRIGHEPDGAQLTVRGEFVGSMLLWSVVYRYYASNEAHVEYLQAIHSVPLLALIDKVA